MDEAEKKWLEDNVEDEFVKGVHPPFRLTKKTDDPAGITRINAGGNLITEQYLVYKGDIEVVELILLNCLKIVQAKIEAKSQANQQEQAPRIITDLNQ